jgi:aspartate aminotransferase-like enzyme
MPKYRLLTPGPTEVPEAARLALAKQVRHHRTADFRALFAEVNAGLGDVFQTESDIITLTCSGSGAMEAAVVNTVPSGGKVIVIEGGVFARRWTHIATAFGMEIVRLEVPWGAAVNPVDVAKLLAQHPDAVAVFATLMESSTGVLHDVKALGDIVRKTPTLLVIDGISGVGCCECRTEEWGIDLLVVGSQKALMLPPGLAFVSVSDKGWAQIEKTKPQAFYFNLSIARQKLKEGPDTPWTPNHMLIAALAENLRPICAEGMPAIWARCRKLGEAARAGFTALGLKIFAQKPADGMTAVQFPPGIDGANLLKCLESRFGIKLASGQDRLKGQIFRLAHFGIVDELDILSCLAALELTLSEMGQPVALGSAVAAAEFVFASGPPS